MTSNEVGGVEAYHQLDGSRGKINEYILQCWCSHTIKQSQIRFFGAIFQVFVAFLKL